jgi:hypothetical protein
MGGEGGGLGREKKNGRRRRYKNLIFIRGPQYIHRLTDKYAVMYIRQLNDEYRGLYSSVPSTFLDFGTEEYSSIIFLSIKEYN